MKPLAGILFLVILNPYCAFAQNVSEIWQTTSDKQSLLKKLSTSNVTFGSSNDGADAVISVDETETFQTIDGFGAALTDSAAYNLYGLKSTDANAYASLLNAMFDVTPGAQSAGMSYIRVPLGASDFSPSDYSYDDQSNDTALSSFSIDKTPTYVYSVLNDIKNINNGIKIHVVPWSPPGWMKDSSSMNAGNFLQQNSDIMANYLFKSVQSFISKGFTPYAVSIQNEPQSQNPTYPSCLYTTGAQAAVAVSLRKLLDSGGMQSVKVIGYEHNWDNAGTYATQLMNENGASDAFAGVAFHCYGGQVSNQEIWHNNFPDKEIYFTECAGTIGSDFWTDIQWYMNNIFIVGLQYWAQSGLMWNFAGNSQGGPKLPTTSSCGGPGCRGVITISGSQYQMNQEYYAMGHAAKAILPIAQNGPYGQRIGVNTTGSQSKSLTVGAYMTNQANGTTGNSRYSIVVLNSANNGVQTAVQFQDKTAMYTFPVGLTTMSWTA